MNDKIKNLIKENEDLCFFTYAKIDDKSLKKVENELDVKLPLQFIDFLNTYGYGGPEGVEILGIGFDGSCSFKDDTIEMRQYGLPIKYIIIENCDEWYYCIDTETNKIVSWSLDNEIIVEFDCFDDYFLDRIHDAIENS